MNEMKELSWDTHFFGFGVGKVIAHNLTSKLLEKIIQQMKDHNYKLVYCFVDPNDSLSNKSLKAENFELVDEKVTYVMGIIENEKKLPSNINSIINNPINEKLLSLALLSGEYSRFKIDKHFPRHTLERLYKKWLENSLNREIAKDVLVYIEDDKEVGFLTLGEKNRRADIGLLAVNKYYRGKGIGTKLIHSACYIASKMNFTQIQVVTQKSNEGACIFYEKVGFTKDRIDNIYHIWL